MCGRFAQGEGIEGFAERLGVQAPPPLTPRYNIAPTREAAIVRQHRSSGLLTLALVRWGLIPPWARDPAMGSRLINARAETVATKPAFRSPFRHRRCLVPTDGFYEWRGEGRHRQPFAIRMARGTPFACAGLWESWRGTGDGILETFTILTTPANPVVAPIHHRMPLILQPGDFAPWLDPGLTDPELLLPLLRSQGGDQLVAHPVSTHVNNPLNDDPRCLEPPSGADGGGLPF